MGIPCVSQIDIKWIITFCKEGSLRVSSTRIRLSSGFFSWPTTQWSANTNSWSRLFIQELNNIKEWSEKHSKMQFWSLLHGVLNAPSLSSTIFTYAVWYSLHFDVDDTSLFLFLLFLMTEAARDICVETKNKRDHFTSLSPVVLTLHWLLIIWQWLLLRIE